MKKLSLMLVVLFGMLFNTGVVFGQDTNKVITGEIVYDEENLFSGVFNDGYEIGVDSLIWEIKDVRSDGVNYIYQGIVEEIDEDEKTITIKYVTYSYSSEKSRFFQDFDSDGVYDNVAGIKDLTYEVDDEYKNRWINDTIDIVFSYKNGNDNDTLYFANTENGDNLTWKIKVNFKNIKIKEEDNTGINNTLQKTNKIIKLYPNPVINTLNVDCDGDFNEIKIYDVSGRLVFSTKDKDKNRIDMSVFENGIYIVNVDGVSKKIVKR